MKSDIDFIKHIYHEIQFLNDELNKSIIEPKWNSLTEKVPDSQRKIKQEISEDIGIVRFVAKV